MKTSFLKYWLLTTEYPPFHGGGISTYSFHTARMLEEKGHEVSVFVNDNTVKDISIETNGTVRVIRFNPSRTGSSEFLGYVTNISYEFAVIVKEFIEKESEPDIIEAQEYLGIAYYLLQFKHLNYEWCSNVPVIITAHSPSFLYLRYNHTPVYRFPYYFIGEMERFCLHAADHVIFPSKFLLDLLTKEYGFENRHASVVVNPFVFTGTGVDERAEDINEIVCLGKLSIQKGTFKVLEYFRQLWSENQKLSLRMIGAQDVIYHPEGRMMGDIVRGKYATYINDRRLILENKIQPSEMRERLGKACIVVVPSTVDNLPYIVLEMMALQKIVLVSKQGGQAEIVDDGADGFIFDHENPSTFFSQLKKIMLLTEEQRKEIAAKAKERIINHYNYDRVYEEKIKVLAALRDREKKRAFPFFHKTTGTNNITATQNVKGLLSVVIPYYNLGKYIDEAILSVRSCSYTSLEIIIVNDGSTEAESLQKLKSYEDKPGIKIIHQPNSGLACSRNRGAQEAQGEYLAFLDADDKVEKGYYTKAIEVFRQYENVHFAGCWTRYFGSSRKVWPTFTPSLPHILYHNTINSSALVYKRSSYLAAGLNDSKMPFTGWEDYEHVIGMVSKGYNGIVLPEIFFNYRVRPDSMIRGVSKVKKIHIYEYITNKHREVYNKFVPDVLGLIQANGPVGELDNPTLDYDVYNKIPFKGKTMVKLMGWVRQNPVLRPVAYKIYRLFNR